MSTRYQSIGCEPSGSEYETSYKYPKETNPLLGRKIKQKIYSNHELLADDKEFNGFVRQTEEAIEEGNYPYAWYQLRGLYRLRNMSGQTVGVFRPKDEENIVEKRSVWSDVMQWLSKYLPSHYLPNQRYLADVGASIFDRHLELNIVPKTRIATLASPSFHYSPIDRMITATKQALSCFPLIGARLHTKLPSKIGAMQCYTSFGDIESYKEASDFLDEYETLELLDDVSSQFQFEFEKYVVLSYLIRNTDCSESDWRVKYDDTFVKEMTEMRSGSSATQTQRTMLSKIVERSEETTGSEPLSHSNQTEPQLNDSEEDEQQLRQAALMSGASYQNRQQPDPSGEGPSGESQSALLTKQSLQEEIRSNKATLEAIFAEIAAELKKSEPLESTQSNAQNADNNESKKAVNTELTKPDEQSVIKVPKELESNFQQIIELFGTKQSDSAHESDPETKSSSTDTTTIEDMDTYFQPIEANVVLTHEDNDVIESQSSRSSSPYMNIDDAIADLDRAIEAELSQTGSSCVANEETIEHCDHFSNKENLMPLTAAKDKTEDDLIVNQTAIKCADDRQSYHDMHQPSTSTSTSRPTHFSNRHKPKSKVFRIVVANTSGGFPVTKPPIGAKNTFSWATLKAAQKPFSAQIRKLILPKLLDESFINKLFAELRAAFELDVRFSEEVFERQRSIICGQMQNLIEVLVEQNRSVSTPRQLANTKFYKRVGKEEFAEFIKRMIVMERSIR